MRDPGNEVADVSGRFFGGALRDILKNRCRGDYILICNDALMPVKQLNYPKNEVKS